MKGKGAFLIAPSILSADFAKLGEEVTNVLAAGADVVHFDVMDNHYVPNLTIGPLVCKALRDHGVKAPIDVHLMVSPVDRIIGDFAEAGASYITFHPEATGHIDRSLQLIRSLGCKSGLVFNPATPLDCLEYVMDKVRALRATSRGLRACVSSQCKPLCPASAHHVPHPRLPPLVSSIRAGRHHPPDVGQPGLWRAEVHPEHDGQAQAGARAHRRVGLRYPPRGRRRRDHRQH
jgi:hypothetical protein